MSLIRGLSSNGTENRHKLVHAVADQHPHVSSRNPLRRRFIGHRFLNGFIREIAPPVAMNAHPDDHRIKPGYVAWGFDGWPSKDRTRPEADILQRAAALCSSFEPR